MNATPNSSFQSVRVSSAECAAHNLKQAAYIDSGLELPWQPDEVILAREKQEAAAKSAKADKAAAATAVLNQIYENLTLAEQTRYTAPTSVDKVNVGEYSDLSVYLRGAAGSVGVGVVAHYSSSAGYRSSFNEYRLVVGERHVKLGQTLARLDDKTVAKALERLREEQVKADAAKLQKDRKDSLYKRGRDFEAAEPELARAIGFSQVYSSSLSSRVNDDGTVMVNYETLTLDQWRQVVALRKVQAEAMAALKASFKTGGAL